MVERMVTRFYRTYEEAVLAVADLAEAGIPEADISIIESETDARLPPDVARDDAQSPASTGGAIGVGIGGGIGALFGVGAIAAPELDWLVSLGWYVPTVVGAILGGAIGALIGIVTKLGVTTHQAHNFAQGLQRGEILVMVRTVDSQAARIEAILARSNPPPPPDLPLPTEPAETPGQVRAGIHREEATIQYMNE